MEKQETRIQWGKSVTKQEAPTQVNTIMSSPSNHHVMRKQMELMWMDWLHVPPLTASRMSTRRLLRLLELIYFSNTFSQLQFDLACEEQK